ncbi:MAG: hypothetical protein II998_03695 [Clostridia bacterium]|nr:hypothetical protein [Clostridia bacterium]
MANNEDILYLPHHQSKKRKHMSMHDRAAQFGAFAALTGYDDAIEETARLTDQRVELTEYVKAEINARLVYLAQNQLPSLPVSIEYFKPDPYKDGGAYCISVGAVLKIDPTERFVYMENDVKIPIDDIISVDSEIFDEMSRIVF